MEIEFENNTELSVQIDAEKIYPSLENLKVIPSAKQQIFNHPNSYGYDNVVVDAVETEELNITPSTENQNFTGLYNSVNVDGDSNLLPENIKKDVSIFGVTGTANVSNLEINDCSYLFYNGARIEQKDNILSICKNVTNTNKMFYNALSTIKNYTYEEFPFDTSKVTNMSYMFESSGLNSFDSRNFDTSNVINMRNMFYNCQNLLNIDLSNFNTSNVTDMSSMFRQCHYIKNWNLKNFNTSKVTDMSAMFYMCNNYMNEIDLSGFNTSNVKNMSNMFYNCTNLTKVNISGFTSENLTNSTYMFSSCSKLSTLIIDSPSVFAMTNINMLNNTAIKNGTGYIYVPDNLVETYKSATNWSIYANQIKPISELEA